MILTTYTLVTNGSFVSVRTGRNRPSGNPSTHLSSLSPPPATAAPAASLPCAPGRGRALRRPPAPHGAAASAPLPPARGALPPSGTAPRKGETSSGRLPRPGRGWRRWREVPPTRSPLLSARPSPGDRAAESSPRPRSALGEFGGVASPLLPHPSTRRTC